MIRQDAARLEGKGGVIGYDEHIKKNFWRKENCDIHRKDENNDVWKEGEKKEREMEMGE